MSPDNVEIVRQSLDEWRKGAEAFARVVSESWDADADYYPARKFPEAQPRRGHAEIIGWFSTFNEAWDTWDWKIERIVPVGDDRVFAQARINAEGQEARVSLQGDIYHCVWLRNGRVLRWEDHLTEAGALEALGVGAGT